jgi:hypothetical protein
MRAITYPSPWLMTSAFLVKQAALLHYYFASLVIRDITNTCVVLRAGYKFIRLRRVRVFRISRGIRVRTLVIRVIRITIRVFDAFNYCLTTYLLVHFTCAPRTHTHTPTGPPWVVHYTLCVNPPSVAHFTRVYVRTRSHSSSLTMRWDQSEIRCLAFQDYALQVWNNHYTPKRLCDSGSCEFWVRLVE